MTSDPKWPITDLVNVIRKSLVERGKWGTQRPYPLPQPRPEPPPPYGGPPPPRLEGELQASLYPFTKGLDLTNDGIGYGEETTVTVMQGKKPVKQLRRRTRTGSIILEPIPPTTNAKSLTSPSQSIHRPASPKKATKKTRPASPKKAPKKPARAAPRKKAKKRP